MLLQRRSNRLLLAHMVAAIIAARRAKLRDCPVAMCIARKRIFRRDFGKRPQCFNVGARLANAALQRLRDVNHLTRMMHVNVLLCEVATILLQNSQPDRCGREYLASERDRHPVFIQQIAVIAAPKIFQVFI